MGQDGQKPEAMHRAEGSVRRPPLEVQSLMGQTDPPEMLAHLECGLGPRGGSFVGRAQCRNRGMRPAEKQDTPLISQGWELSEPFLYLLSHGVDLKEGKAMNLSLSYR